MPDESIELELTDVAATGEAIGRHNNRVIFVPHGAPGDLVRVRLTVDKPRFARAEIVDLLRASPDRVQPPCLEAARCHGCQWQHIAYERQIELKQRIVASQLMHVGGLMSPNVQPTIGMDEPWEYLNYGQWEVDPEGTLRFLAPLSDDSASLDECPLLDPALQDLATDLELDWPGLRRLTLRLGVNTGDLMAIFESQDDEAPELELDIPISCVLLRSNGSFFPLVGDPFIYETVLDRRIRISPESFFHPNTAAAEMLVTLLADHLQPSGDETLLDLFSGVGTFGLSLAERVGQVIAVEESPTTADDARANAEGVDNYRLIEGSVEDVLVGIEGPVQVAVMDPTWEGLAPAALEGVLRLRPRRLAYVSTDTATLARDGARLAEAGYRLEVAQPVDMLPQTRYVTTVAVWIAT